MIFFLLNTIYNILVRHQIKYRMPTLSEVFLTMGGYVIIVPGNGDCGLQSLIICMGLDINTTELRAVLCNHLNYHDDHEMRVVGTWIDEQIFIAMCAKFNINICIINEMGFVHLYRNGELTDIGDDDNHVERDIVYIKANGVDEQNQTTNHFDAIMMNISFEVLRPILEQEDIRADPEYVKALTGVDTCVEVDICFMQQLIKKEEQELIFAQQLREQDLALAQQVREQEEHDWALAQQVREQEEQNLALAQQVREQEEQDLALAQQAREQDWVLAQQLREQEEQDWVLAQQVREQEEQEEQDLALAQQLREQDLGFAQQLNEE